MYYEYADDSSDLGWDASDMNEYIDPENAQYCGHCSGSGQGTHEDETCFVCNGSGEVNNR